ncbi:hypothetical protein GSF67_11455 [Agrobacterium sp. CGMCC 11546]|nr:hypothetical protein GSF67_11455 [Agrobacterium sp. CGMCC 11546]
MAAPSALPASRMPVSSPSRTEMARSEASLATISFARSIAQRPKSPRLSIEIVSMAKTFPRFDVVVPYPIGGKTGIGAAGVAHNFQACKMPAACGDL